MSYITTDDLKAYLPEAELTNITEEVEEGVTNVEVIVNHVNSLATSMLKSKYDIPLSEDYDTTQLITSLIDITIWKMSNLFSSISEETKSIRQKNYDDAMNYLTQIQSGSIKLIDNNTEALKQSDRYAFNSNVRITKEFR